MSLVHLDKSVLSFHLREIVEDPPGNNNSAALFGLGAIAFGTVALPAMIKFGRPVLKNLIKPFLAASQSSDFPYSKIEAKFPPSWSETQTGVPHISSEISP
ncbi:MULTISPECIES: hypothetical protein [Planktothricoides]|uniref:Uncharacterized protein n=1 Tax=Planktothricoides raciborskii GIHE-MW2 TaxID=2792601 RepID=A0AAU8JP56_9CYAN|nr:hypothetical protein [Planktothricoides sp. SR001]